MPAKITCGTGLRRFTLPSSSLRLCFHCSMEFEPIHIENWANFGEFTFSIACVSTSREFSGGKVAVSWAAGGPSGGTRAALFKSVTGQTTSAITCSTFLYPPLRLRTCQTACVMVPPAVLAFIVWTRLRLGRMPPADPVQEAEDDLGQVAEDELGQLAEDELMQVAEDDPMQEVNDELANLEFLLLALYALAAVLTAYPASGHRNAYRYRGVYYVKPRDQTWWELFADGCVSDEEWRRHFRITRQRALHHCQCLCSVAWQTCTCVFK